MPSIPPICLWAQRSSADDESKNVIFLTIQVVDPVNTKLDLTSTNLKLSADSSDSTDDPTHWDLNIDFYEEIDVDNSIKNLENGSHIYLVLRKSKAQEEFWPRLTKEKLKYHYIKTDFDKWVDEDEQDEVAEQDEDLMAGGPPGGMGGMPGMGGPPGMGGAGGMDFASMMGGAGGAGGPGGMDFASMMGGAGGAGGMDFSKMMAGLGGAGGEGADDFDISKLASQLGQAGEGAKDGEEVEEVEEVEEIKK